MLKYREHSGSLQIYSDDQCTTTLSPTPEHHHHSEVRTTQGHSHNWTAEAGGRLLIYIGPQTLSRTFLITPDNSGTLHRRPFLDRSRQHGNSREAARHFRNVPNCAVNRNYAVAEWRNHNTLRTIPRDAGETENVIRNNILLQQFYTSCENYYAILLIGRP